MVVVISHVRTGQHIKPVQLPFRHHLTDQICLAGLRRIAGAIAQNRFLDNQVGTAFRTQHLGTAHHIAGTNLALNHRGDVGEIAPADGAEQQQS